MQAWKCTGKILKAHTSIYGKNGRGHGLHLGLQEAILREGLNIED
jgi:hypothetical protein